MKVYTTKKIYSFNWQIFGLITADSLELWRCYMAADYKVIYKLSMILSLYCKHYEYYDGINFEVMYNTEPILCIRIFIHKWIID